MHACFHACLFSAETTIGVHMVDDHEGIFHALVRRGLVLWLFFLADDGSTPLQHAPSLIAINNFFCM